MTNSQGKKQFSHPGSLTCHSNVVEKSIDEWGLEFIEEVFEKLSETKEGEDV